MGKVKTGIDNHAEGMAEWVGRKLSNHDPMAVRDSQKGKTPVSKRVHVDENTILYSTSDGKVFRMTVEQVDGPISVTDEYGEEAVKIELEPGG